MQIPTFKAHLGLVLWISAATGRGWRPGQPSNLHPVPAFPNPEAPDLEEKVAAGFLETIRVRRCMKHHSSTRTGIEWMTADLQTKVKVGFADRRWLAERAIPLVVLGEQRRPPRICSRRTDLTARALSLLGCR